MQFVVRNLGTTNFEETWHAMQEFTEARTVDTADEFWLLEHSPVFTQGLAGRVEHMLNLEHDIPVVHTDRGGQVTYHGPGQLIVYTLVDLKRSNLSIRDLVSRLELGVINYLSTFGILANGDKCAPGVYISGKKIASLGLKVRKGCTYHGLSFNINMNTTPFSYINVCGYSGLQVTQLSNLIPINNTEQVAKALIQHITDAIYTKVNE